KSNSDVTVADRTSHFDLGYEGNGFWILSPNLDYENNIAASCAGDAYRVFSGDAALPEAHKLKIPVGNLAVPAIAGSNDSISTSVVPLRYFSGNIAYNSSGGMSFWTHLY